jgi:adenylate cyclase
VRGAITALAFTLAVLLIASLSRPVENLFRDVLASAASPFTDPGESVVLVTVTEETLAALPYRSPIDRGFLADLIEHIGKAQPRAVGIDILFDQPTEPQKDERLARVLEEARFPLVVASAEAADGLTQRQIDWLAAFSASTPRGLATLSLDPFDGVVRRLFAGRMSQGVWRPGFAEAVALAGGSRPPAMRADMVYFRTAEATPHAFPAYPAHAARFLPAEWFRGKHVLIGVDLPLDDRHPTPFAALNGVKAGTLPGVVIHAHALAQIRGGQSITRAGVLPVGLLLLSGMGLAGWLAWRPLPVLLKPPLLMGLLAAIIATAALLYWRFGVVVPAIWPSVLVAGVFTVVAFLAWHRDNDERRFIRQAFSQYVSPAVVDTILRDPGSLRLGGERRTITCVFTDLEGFTGFSEGLAPERTALLLNDYLDRVCDLFVAHGATIDKVIGDSVVGFFGAPAPQEDQAMRAVALALELDLLAEEFRAGLAADGVSLGVTRIGVHSGPAIVGNFGGKRFFDYTAIGDTVNTASRLEGANRYLGTRICVSAQVVEAATEYTYRPAGIIYLKGKNRGIEVFEPLNADAAVQTYLDEYRGAYELMRSGNRGAGEAFSRLAALHPEDRLAAFHNARLASGASGPDIHLSEK